MRRFLCMILFFALILGGCSGKESASFYYCRNDYIYNSADGVITSEKRDITGHADDLGLLVSLYLMGPLEKNLHSPFPAETKLISVDTSDTTLVLTISDVGYALSESEYTLACTCLALTCLEFTQSSTVTIVSGEKSISIDPAQLTLYDSALPVPTETGG